MANGQNLNFTYIGQTEGANHIKERDEKFLAEMFTD